MSLDVYLNDPEAPEVESVVLERIFVRENGSNVEVTRDEWEARYPGREPVAVVTEEPREQFSGNITHNLGAMAAEAGIYKYLWRPDEIEVTHARQLVEPLRDGLALLISEPDRMKAHNPTNGWGDYDGFVAFVRDYLAACERHPDAEVSVWR